MPTHTTQSSQFRSEGGRLVTVDGRDLPLTGVEVKTEAGGGIARVTLTQHFKNPYEEPLHVTYQVPMPQDGAVAGYAFTIGAKRVVGEVDRLKKARERFERAIVEGRTAALLTQERSNLFTQELGNVPPGERITVELVVDQRLRWLSEGMWEWRFPTVVPPRYLGAEGRVPDADRVSVDVANKPTGIGATLEVSIIDALAERRSPESPSHTMQFATAAGRTTARLSEGVPLDRDLVLRWPVATPAPGVTVLTARPSFQTAASESAYALVTVVPPAIETSRLPRDLSVLLDISGSMSGPPMDRAKQVVAQLIETLDERDTVELIAFSDRPFRWKKNAVPVNEKSRREAIGWLMSLSAGGGTEMKSGIEEAIRPLRGEGQRQVVLVTDGHIGFESEIVKELIEHLPKGSRLHAIGVGSSVNRALTGPAARAGHGVEIIVDLAEDAERGAARIVAATRAPVIVDLVAEGDALLDCAPQSIPDLMAGAPVLLSLKVRPQGGTITLKGRTPEGSFNKTLTLQATNIGEGLSSVAALYAREKVEDLEMKLAGGIGRAEIDTQIETIGITHQIATRLTSWVAVTAEQTVDPTAPTRRETVPQALPHGMSAQGIGLRGASMMPAPRASAASGGPGGGMFQSPSAPPPPPMKAGRAFGKMSPPADLDDEGYMAPAEEAAFDEAAAPEPERARRDASEKKKGEVAPMRPSRSSAAAPKPPAAQKVPAPAPRQEAKETTRVFLKGRKVVSVDGKITVEIEADAMDWDPDATFEAKLDDGTNVVLKVDKKSTTRKSKVNAGALLRLTFEAPNRDPQSINFSIAGVVYRVEL